MALIPPQINLGLQVIILALLFASLALKRKRKYFAHGATILIAVILNALSFLLVMMPSLLALEILKTQPLHWVFTRHPSTCWTRRNHNNSRCMDRRRMAPATIQPKLHQEKGINAPHFDTVGDRHLPRLRALRGLVHKSYTLNT